MWLMKHFGMNIGVMMYKRILWIVILILSFLIFPVNATVVSINTTNDTYITEVVPDTPQGTGDVIYVGHFPSTEVNKGLVKFSLSSIPSGSVINSATLYMYEYSGGNIGYIQSIYNVTSSWNETNVTWNTQPTFTSTPFTYADGLASAGWMNWNVKNTVSSWIRGGISNNGFLLNETSINPSALGYRTKEYGNYIPYLYVNYTANAAPTVPVTTQHANYSNADLTAISWSASTDTEGDTITYHYNVGTITGGTDIFNDKTTTGTVSTQFNPSPTNTYYYSVKACDSWNCSTWSAEKIFYYEASSAVSKTLDYTAITDSCYIGSAPGKDCNDGFSFIGNNTYTYRNYMKWNLSTIPSGHTISTSTLNGWVITGRTFNLNTYNITSSWDTTTLAWGTQPTIAGLESATAIPNQGWYTWSITNMFKTWYAGTNYGIAFRSSDENTITSGSDMVTTSTAFGAGYRMYITVYLFNTKPTIPSLIQHLNLTDTNSTTVNWTASTDYDGDSITYDVKIYNTTTGVLVIDQTGTSNNYSQSFIPDTLTSYNYTARSYDGIEYSNWSSVLSFTYNTAPTVPTLYTNFTIRTNLTPTVSWTKGTDIDGDNVTTYVYVGENETNLTLEGSYSGTSSQIGINKTLLENTNYSYRMRSYDGFNYSSNTSLSNFTTGVVPIFSNESVPSTGTINVALNIDINIDVGTSNISTHTVTLTDPNSNINTYTLTLVSGLTYRKSYAPTTVGNHTINYYNATDEAGLSNSTLSTKTIVVSVASSTGGGGGGAIITPTPTPIVTEYKPSIDITSIGESSLGIILLEILLLGGFIVFVSGLLEEGKMSSLIVGFIIIGMSTYGLGWLS